jgi:hypothetical protein
MRCRAPQSTYCGNAGPNVYATVACGHSGIYPFAANADVAMRERTTTAGACLVDWVGMDSLLGLGGLYLACGMLAYAPAPCRNRAGVASAKTDS